MVPQVPHTPLLLPSLGDFLEQRFLHLLYVPRWFPEAINSCGGFYNFYQLCLFSWQADPQSSSCHLPDRSLKAYFYPTDSCKCLLLILIKINLEVLKNKQF